MTRAFQYQVQQLTFNSQDTIIFIAFPIDDAPKSLKKSLDHLRNASCPSGDLTLPTHTIACSTTACVRRTVHMLVKSTNDIAESFLSAILSTARLTPSLHAQDGKGCFLLACNSLKVMNSCNMALETLTLVSLKPFVCSFTNTKIADVYSAAETITSSSVLKAARFKIAVCRSCHFGADKKTKKGIRHVHSASYTNKTG